MTRYLLSSHDGYGLGHVRRNALLAAELLRQDPQADITLITGVPKIPAWLRAMPVRIVRAPALVKDCTGRYRNTTMPYAQALEVRADLFTEVVREHAPQVVLVDRHPFGTGGELRPGLARARRAGAQIILGLRDILDEPTAVRAELDGPAWHGASDIYDEILVFGDPVICDHTAEYKLPIRPVYCGWVVERHPRARPEADLLVVSAGGGGDGAAVFDMAIEVTRLRRGLRTVIAAGPYADWQADALIEDPDLAGRISLERDSGSTGALLARAGASIQMAGYNTTVESLAAGLRPILVPRRTPRREQAIRAARLTSLGLGDIVDEHASPAELSWLLDQPRRLSEHACARAGISFGGAAVAANRMRMTTALAGAA